MSARRLLLVGLLSTTAIAEKLAMPGDDERAPVTGRVGNAPFLVMPRANYVIGKRSDLGDYTQGGGEAAFDFAIMAFPTGFGGMFGFEGDASLGLMRSEAYASGQLRDFRTDADTDPRMWVTTRLGLRYAISPRPLIFGSTALRLGLVGGLQIEGSGARSWSLAGAFTAGAHLSLGGPGFGAMASWLAIPPQGQDSVLTRHQFAFDLGLGPIVIGARVQLDHLDTRAMQGNPASTLDSMTFSLSIGYRSPALDL